jgi:polysaccharide export outer membrane protein
LSPFIVYVSKLIFSCLASASLLVACADPGPGASNGYGSQASGNRTARAGYRQTEPTRRYGNGSLRRSSFEPGQFRTWVETDPIYRLLPGDQLNVFVYSAPELNQTLIVGPDGRVVMPLARPIMAANLTIEELEQRLRNALGSQLVDPDLELSPLAYGSQRIFVGGQVGQPGIYELPGQIGTLEAIFMAGGFTNTSKTNYVVLVRRHPSGAPMLKVIDVRSVLKHAVAADMTPLRRGDVIYVPMSTIGNINLFMQQYIRDALPITFGLTYDLAQQIQ